MNILATLFSELWLQRLGWMLIHFIWQGTIIAILLALILRMMTRSSSHIRYATIGGALFLCGIMPVVTWTILGSQTDRSALSAVNSEIAYAPIADIPATLPSRPDPLAASWLGDAGILGQHSLNQLASSALPYVVCFWFGGMLILTIRLMLGWTVLRQMCRASAPIQDSLCLEKFRTLVERMQVGPVRLLESALVEVPTLIGWLHPTILIPASILIGLSPDQLEAILAHELAHVRRHDYLVNLFQTVIETIFFYHPAVWWISQKLREERENCCDDMAIEVMQNRSVYASALASLEERRALPLALTASGGSLLRRIRRIAGVEGRKSSLVPALAIFLLVATLAWLVIPKAAAAPSETSPIPSNGSGTANLAIMSYLGHPFPPPSGLDAKYSTVKLMEAFTSLSKQQNLHIKKLAVDDSEFPFLIYGVMTEKWDTKVFEQNVHQLNGYDYGGSVWGRTDQRGTYFSVNMIPYNKFPSNPCSRRLMIRLQMLADSVRQGK